MQKVPIYEAATAWNRGIPCIFSKYLSDCICFFYFSIFELLYEIGYQRQYFWTLNLNVLDYEAAMFRNRGIPYKHLKLIIKLYLFCLLFYCSTWCIKKVIRGKVFWFYVKRMSAYEADTSWNRGSLCIFFQNYNPIVFIMFIHLLLELLYQRGYQS